MKKKAPPVFEFTTSMSEILGPSLVENTVPTFELTASLWSDFLGPSLVENITPAQVASMIVLLRTACTRFTPEDSKLWVQIAATAAGGAETI